MRPLEALGIPIFGPIIVAYCCIPIVVGVHYLLLPISRKLAIQNLSYV